METLVWRRFDAFDVAELYAVLKLRVDIFVVEQSCAYPELDGRDPAAEHLLAYADDTLVGTLRLFPPDGSGAARIGRVAVAPSVRGGGLGRRMMHAGIARACQHDGATPIELDAQLQLEAFYGSLGFVRIGPDYLDAGLPHCNMRRG